MNPRLPVDFPARSEVEAAYSLRCLLSSLAGANESQSRIESAHAELSKLAGRVIRGGWRQQVEPAELVSDFTVRMLEKPMSKRREDVQKLSSLEDRALLGAISHRLFQLCTERGARADLRKSMREHVKKVWDDERAGTATFPNTLLSGERISGDLVRQAVCYLRGTPAFAQDDANAVADHLLNEFFPLDVPLDEMRQESGDDRVSIFRAIMESTESRLGRKQQAYELAKELAEKLGPELSDIVVRKLVNYETLAEIAHARGLNSAAAVFNRLERAKGIIRECFTTRETTDRTELLAIELLGALNGLSREDALARHRAVRNVVG